MLEGPLSIEVIILQTHFEFLQQPFLLQLLNEQLLEQPVGLN